MKRLTVLFGFAGIVIAAALAPSERTTEAQPACFADTGFCINNSSFLGYFNARGGIRTFGPPISREFVFLGFRVQFFQGHIMQLQPNGGVATMNLLDEGLMPVSRINGSTFPSSDQNIVSQTPGVSEPNYADRIVDFIRRNSPNDFSGQPVRFFDTFVTTVPAEALPGGLNPNQQALFNLEIWGSVTSGPMVEPTNSGFIYQRYQRSIMHYRDSCRCTERILLADWFKTVITGQGLPGDLAEEMARSPYIYQWRPGAPNSLARPNELQNTDMTNAFAPDLPGFAAPPAAPDRGGSPPPAPGATATPTAEAGAPTISLEVSDDTVRAGERFTITLEASSEKGIQSMFWFATGTDDDDLLNTHTFECNGAPVCRNSWRQSTDENEDPTIHAQARDSEGRLSAEATKEITVRRAATPTPTPQGTPKP